MLCARLYCRIICVYGLHLLQSTLYNVFVREKGDV